MATAASTCAAFRRCRSGIARRAIHAASARTRAPADFGTTARAVLARTRPRTWTSLSASGTASQIKMIGERVTVDLQRRNRGGQCGAGKFLRQQEGRLSGLRASKVRTSPPSQWRKCPNGWMKRPRLRQRSDPAANATAARSAGGTCSSARSAVKRPTRNWPRAMPRGFAEQINGKDLSNWQGAVDNYEVVEGAIALQARQRRRPANQGRIRERHHPCRVQAAACRQQWHRPAHPLGGHSASDGLELQVIDSDGYNAKQAAAGKPGLQPYQYHGSPLPLRGCQARLPPPRRRVELPGDRSAGPAASRSRSMAPRFSTSTSTALTARQIPHPPKGLDARKGFIGFAGHSDPVAFRSFKVKRM